MFEQLTNGISSMLTGSFAPAALGCFIWGLFTVFFSVCHLASIPLVVGYVAGQGIQVRGKQAAGYSLLFSFGIFISISVLGVSFALLGRALGEIFEYGGVLIGLIFIFMGLGLMGVRFFHAHTENLLRFRMRGWFGALVLGLLFGVLSVGCTFGFISPILVAITISGDVAWGVSMIFFFALGHCLPIIVAGSSTVLVQRLLARRVFNEAAVWGRRLAGLLVTLIGVYFIFFSIFHTH